MNVFLFSVCNVDWHRSCMNIGAAKEIHVRPRHSERRFGVAFIREAKSMLRRNVVVAGFVVAGLVAAVNMALAQSAQRRDGLRKVVKAGVAIGADVAENGEKSDAVADGFKGRALVLKEGEPEGKQSEAGIATDKVVNLGGLVLLQVTDTEGGPTKFGEAEIEPEGAFQRLGRLRGIRTNEQGEDMLGGGYTWLVLKPTGNGEASITVTYTPNGGDGKELTRTHKVTIVKTDD